MSEQKLLLKLKDGGIVDIDTDKTVRPRCPTCDYGSEYIDEFWIELTKSKIYAQTNQMYDFAFSEQNMMEIILPNIEKIFLKMTEEEFSEWFREKVLEVDKDARFEVTKKDKTEELER